MSGRGRNRGIRSKWSEQTLKNAVTAVVASRMSRQAASRTFSIPRRTLSRYVDNNRTNKSTMRRRTTLTVEQAEEVSSRIVRLAEVGYPLTSRALRRCVFNFCTENGIPNKFSIMSKMAGRYWLNGFLKPNPEIRKRKAQGMNPARAQKLNKFIVNDYFEKLEEVLLELNFMNSPERIYNVDEKGCRLSLHHQQNVLARKGAKRVHLVAPEHGENVIIVSCSNAGGNSIPPTILFKGRRLKSEWTDTLPPGSLVLMTPKGSMNITTFCTWIEHLAKYKPARKCLLIFDGAKCHLDHTIVEVAERHDIVLFCLPNKSLTPANIKAGFAATGIFPFNPEAIPDVAFAPSVVTQVEEQPREEPIVKPTINERVASPTAGPSNIRKRPAFPKAGPSNIRELKITTDYSSDSTDDNYEEERIPFLDDSDDENEYQSNEPLNNSETPASSKSVCSPNP
ncbi:hypothetical protein NQ314_005025 [Rhamnusium bicolor]|uniref:Transposase n=1 Tax=Rhamnusium bicolor TaxID=1586634 RepID=A0AAV8ZJQ5_9CUCU|nr:hypothetical protein NQ314_005025 [Rhamnusium bicolor]